MINPSPVNLSNHPSFLPAVSLTAFIKSRVMSAKRFSETDSFIRKVDLRISPTKT